MRAALVLLVGGVGLYACLVVALGCLPRPGQADLAVIFGSAVRADGTPSARLAARLEAGLLAWRGGRAPLILVSGGRGATGFDEADIMRLYLLRHGVPDTAIRMDSDGVDTMRTARHTVALMRSLHLQGVLVVTQYFHVPRCILALRRAGVAEVRTAWPRFWEPRDLYSIGREMVALPAYAIRRADPA